MRWISPLKALEKTLRNIELENKEDNAKPEDDKTILLNAGDCVTALLKARGVLK